MYLYLYVYLYIYMFIYIVMFRPKKNKIANAPRRVNNSRIEGNQKNTIYFIKDAHQFKDSIACPETSVRVWFWG